MKNIKLRIVYLILCSALLLFALFMLAVNLIIPAHFVREAKKALISEAQYQNRTIPYTDDGSFFDDEWNDTEEHFLTPSIVFLELDNANQSSGWNRDAYRLEKKLLEYCKGRDLSLGQCYTFKMDKHHLIFMSVQEEQDDWEKPYAYIMYIDIGPITRYIVTLNWAFFAVLLAISSVMCLLGFRFGRDIEKEAEQQQTFFQNASHELKTPLMAIQGYAEGIQAGVMDTGSAAEVILEESDRMTELVEELLDISKIDMGRQQLALSEMDIRELLYDSIRAVESAAAASGITIAPPLSVPLVKRTGLERIVAGAGRRVSRDFLLCPHCQNGVHLWTARQKNICIFMTGTTGGAITAAVRTGNLSMRRSFLFPRTRQERRPFSTLISITSLPFTRPFWTVSLWSRIIRIIRTFWSRQGGSEAVNRTGSSGRCTIRFFHRRCISATPPSGAAFAFLISRCLPATSSRCPWTQRISVRTIPMASAFSMSCRCTCATSICF